MDAFFRCAAPGRRITPTLVDGNKQALGRSEQRGAFSFEYFSLGEQRKVLPAPARGKPKTMGSLIKA